MLELFSLKVDKNTFFDEVVYYIEMPKSWQEYIESKTKPGSYVMKIRPIDFEKKIKTIFPEIFEVKWKNEPWMLADDKINISLIKHLYLQWFAENEKCTIDELKPELLNADLVIHQATMGELQAKYKNENWLYSWIPALMARRFAKKTKHFVVEGAKDFKTDRKLNFYHVYFNDVHECMSEPVRENSKKQYFSYVIRFKYENRGLLPEEGIVNVKMGIRRYMHKSINEIKNRYSNNLKGSILIGMKEGFYKKKKIESLSKWSFESKKNSYFWERKYGDSIFADILMNKGLQPYQILNNPKEFIENDDVNAFVILNERYFNVKDFTNVKNGIGLPEKISLFELVKEEFPNLEPLEKLKIITRKREFNTGTKEGSSFVHRYDEGSTIHIHVWSENELVDKIIPVLGEKNVIINNNRDGTYLVNAHPRVNLSFTQHIDTEIVEPVYKEKERINLISNKIASLKEQEGLVESLIEIPEKETFYENEDPKNLVRKAFATNGHLTQFIYPFNTKVKDPLKEYENRITSSVLDLLIDLGFLRGTTLKISSKKHIVAMSIINRIPVLFQLIDAEIRVKLYILQKNGAKTLPWLYLNEALLEVSKLKISIKDINRDELKERLPYFFIKGIQEVLYETEGEVLVIADARLKNWWPVFRNGDLQLTKLPFDLEMPNVEDRIRVVRVNGLNEVPDHRTIRKNDSDKPSRISGLYYDKSGIYYSVGGRPDTWNKIFNDDLKIKTPSKALFNLHLLEIIVLGAKDRAERDEIALIVDQLRRVNIAYNSYTKFPFPLHLNGAIKKYMHLSSYFENENSYSFDNRIIDTSDYQLTFNLEEAEVNK